MADSIFIRRLEKIARDPLPHQDLASDLFSVRKVGKRASHNKLTRIMRLGKDRYLELKKRKPMQTAAFGLALFVGGVFLTSQSGDFFLASLTEQPQEFTGTVYPFKKAPDWFAVGGKNNTSYTDYQPSQLVDAPRYDIGKMKKDGWIKDIVNTQITYPIVYMSKYTFDHNEYSGSHPAVDIKLAPDTPTFAIANGKVVVSKDTNYGYGKYIVIEHNNVPEYGTLYSSYSHLNSRIVSVGQQVQKGQEIGKVGSTGNSTTSHIHFQIDKASADFHPYWPFTTADANAAGYDFFGGVNAGFGKENAIAHTIHPFEFIHKYENTTTNISSKTHAAAPVEKTPVPTILPVRTESKLGGFRLSAKPLRTLVGDPVKIEVLSADEAGNFYDGLNENITLTYELRDKKLEMKNGEGDANISFSSAGNHEIKVSYGSVSKTVSIEVLERQRETINTEPEKTPEPTPTPEVEKIPDLNNIPEGVEKKEEVTSSGNEGDFSLFEFSGPHEVIKGQSTTIVMRALDSKGSPIVSTDFPKGTFVLSSQNGSVSPILIQSGDFKDGVIRISFTGNKQGRGFIKINDTTHAIKVNSEESLLEIAQENNDTVLSGVNVSPFSDVTSDHPNASAIGYLKTNNIVSGYNDGTFQPNKTVTRAEALKMIFSALDISSGQGRENPFGDVVGTDWFSEYVMTAYTKGIVDGYSDGTFKPAKTVNRSEYFKILLESANIPLGGIPSKDPFADTPASSWFAPYAQFSKIEKLLNFGTHFNPTQGITRAEVAESLYRLLK